MVTFLGAFHTVIHFTRLSYVAILYMIEVDKAFVTKPTSITIEIHAKPPPAWLLTVVCWVCAMLNVASRHRRWQRRPAKGDTPHLPSQINPTTPAI